MATKYEIKISLPLAIAIGILVLIVLISTTPQGTTAKAFLPSAVLDLKNYPTPFVQRGAWLGTIVASQDAPFGDVIAVTDIAAGLQPLIKPQKPLFPFQKQQPPGGLQPVAQGVIAAKLDTEVTPSDVYLILVGNEGVNREIANVKKVKYVFDANYGNAQAIGVGSMTLQKDGRRVVLIAGGPTAKDTRLAATALKSFVNYKANKQLFGTKCTVGFQGNLNCA